METMDDVECDLPGMSERNAKCAKYQIFPVFVHVTILTRDVAEISRRMYEKIRSSRDPRDNVEDG